VEVEHHKNFPFYLFLDGWGGASVSAPPAGFSENVVNTPDGGLISNPLLEAKNATKTAKKFLPPPKKNSSRFGTSCITKHINKKMPQNWQ